MGSLDRRHQTPPLLRHVYEDNAGMYDPGFESFMKTKIGVDSPRLPDDGRTDPRARGRPGAVGSSLHESPGNLASSHDWAAGYRRVLALGAVIPGGLLHGQGWPAP